jgi:hypothetical protein
MRRLALLALAWGVAAAAPLRDPFARPAPAAPAQPAAAMPKPQLRAVMYEPGHSLANVNGQIVAVGDWFGEYRVTAIGTRTVTLARQGKATVLALDAGDAK